MTVSKDFLDICNFHDVQLHALDRVMHGRAVYYLYGGAAGGGKSYFLRWLGIYALMFLSQQYGLSGIRIGLFCEDFPSLKERHLSKVRYEFPEWLGTLHETEKEFRLKPEYGGGVLTFRNLDDPQKYLSSEFAWILVDEITRNKEQVFNFLRLRMRWPGVKKDHIRFVAASNPGGEGHVFVRRYWIDKNYEGTNLREEDFEFIPAKAMDNPHLDPGYIELMNSLPDHMREAYMNGNWDIFEGQYFTEFSRDKHVVEPFTDPDTIRWFKSLPTYAGLDYGYTAPSCVLYGKRDAEGCWWIYNEIYVTKHTYEMLRDRICITEVPKQIYADPSIWAKKDQPKSGFMTMTEDRRLHIIRGANERVQGWIHLKQLFLEGKIKIFSNCKNLIETLPTLVYDTSANNIEDLDTQGLDHACLVGETEIITMDGVKTMLDIEVGDFIYTPLGFKRVLDKKYMGVKDTSEVSIGAHTITLTSNHPIATGHGFTGFDTLRYDAYIGTIDDHYYLWNYLRNSFGLKERSSTGMDGTTSPLNAPRLGCTCTYGSPHTGQCQRGIISTTKTITQQITTSRIWKWLRKPNILESICKKSLRTLSTVKRYLLNLKECDLKPQSGTDQKKEGHGTRSMGKTRGRSVSQRSTSVSGAASNVSPKIVRLAIVEALAKREHGEKDLRIRPVGARPVYDITVEDAGCFYANGILVSNCDALRYLTMTHKKLYPQNEALTYIQSGNIYKTTSSHSEMDELFAPKPTSLYRPNYS